MLALLLTDITNAFWTTVARAVEDVAMEAGYGVLLCNTDEDRVKEARYLDLLLRRQIDGLVVAPTSESTQILRNLKKRRRAFRVDGQARKGRGIGQCARRQPGGVVTK